MAICNSIYNWYGPTLYNIPSCLEIQFQATHVSSEKRLLDHGYRAAKIRLVFRNLLKGKHKIHWFSIFSTKHIIGLVSHLLL